MAELEVDQSNLPKVQEVCQCFAVLEDGALAHNLQEQEIEQYYSSNVQRNQLVQNDIRIAKRLQDEEKQQAYTLQRQATQQLEEQDSEYARRIQEELQRSAEESLRREIEDEEIAKRIQEEEELLVRQGLCLPRANDAEIGSVPTTHHTLQPERPLLSEEEEQYDWASPRRAYLPSPSTSDYEEDHTEQRKYHSDGRREQHQQPRCDPPQRSSIGHGSRSFVRQSSQLGQGSLHSGRPISQMGQGNRSSISQSFPLEQDIRSSLNQISQFGQSRRRCVRQSSQNGQGSRSSISQSSQLDLDSRTSVSQSSSSMNFQGGWGDVVKLIKNDLCEQGYLGCDSDNELFEPVYQLERILSHRQKTPDQFGVREVTLNRHSSVRDASGRMCQERTICSDSRSVRPEIVRVRRYNSSCSNSRSGDSQRHVHFKDDTRCHNGYYGKQRTFESDTRDQEIGSYTVSSYPVRTQRGLGKLYPITASGDQYHLQSQGFQQHNQVMNVHISRRTPIVEMNTHHTYYGFPQSNGIGSLENLVSQESIVRQEEESRRGSCRVQREPIQRDYSLWEKERLEARESRRYSGNHRERRVQQGNEEDSSSTEDEEVKRERRKEERRARRIPQRSLSLACKGQSSRAGPVLRRNGASLDMGELEQVLLDEELARRLQEEEEKLLRCDPQSTPDSTLQRSFPEGDFRVAQVAQDEEIARFIQKQEIKAKRHSRELEGCGTGRQYRAMTNDQLDDRVADGRQVQRERLDSEGLLSPTEEFSPEHQPPSPIAMAVQQHQFRNIAEELDPTFHRKENIQAGPDISGPCQIQATQQRGSCDITQESTFVQPTKRMTDKPVRVKTKEKKENTRAKENCKQQ